MKRINETLLKLTIVLIVFTIVLSIWATNKVIDNHEKKEALIQGSFASAHHHRHRKKGLVHLNDGPFLVDITDGVFDVTKIEARLEKEFKEKFGRLFISTKDKQVINKPMVNADYKAYQINQELILLHIETTLYSSYSKKPIKEQRVWILDERNQEVVTLNEWLNDKEKIQTLVVESLNKEQLWNDDLSIDVTDLRANVFNFRGVLASLNLFQNDDEQHKEVETTLYQHDLDAFLKLYPEPEPEPEPEKPPVTDPVPTPTPTNPELPPATGSKLLAFTFDDGPHNDVTTRIVNAFAAYGGYATFFVVGNRVTQYPDTLLYAFNQGHQIGNHSYSHPSLATLDGQSIANQINATNEAIINVTGVSPTVVRPTYGAVSDTMLSVINMPMINWTIDTRDWASQNANSVVNAVLNNVRSNSIILMHDLYSSTAEAVEILLPILSELGYQFVTIDQLASYQGIALQPNQVYWSIGY